MEEGVAEKQGMPDTSQRPKFTPLVLVTSEFALICMDNKRHGFLLTCRSHNKIQRFLF